MIYHTDCIEGMRSVASESVDLIFADPPFNMGYSYDKYSDRLTPEQYLAWTREWLLSAHRVLKPNGTIWVASGDEYAAEVKVAASEFYYMRSWVIWYYTFGVNCRNNFSRSHTHLFYMTKDNKEFTFNAPPIRVPSARLLAGDMRADPDGRLPDNTWILRPEAFPEGFDVDHDVWRESRVCGTFKERAGFHGCQMPEKVLDRIISACSNSGDFVLDPFSGSGTTAAVAKKLGRECVAFDISEEYVRLGNLRVESTQ